MKILHLQSNHQPFRRHDDRVRHHVRNFPQTDYHFQATADSVATSRRGRAKVGLSDLRDFRKISSDLMAAEAHRDFMAEAALFALVAGIAAWPIISMLIVLAQTARG